MVYESRPEVKISPQNPQPSIGANGGPPLDELPGNWFAVCRTIFDHPIVGIHDRAFTELEAWLWLLSEAAFEPRKVINKGTIIVLDPGQLMHARSYLAKRWQWTEDKVRWFFKRLQTEAMITRYCTQQNTRSRSNQIQIITISNYSVYQGNRQPQQDASPPPQHPANTQPTPSAHPANTHKVTTKQDLKEDPRAQSGPKGSFWKNVLNPGASQGVEIDADGRPHLVNGMQAKWLEEFGGDQKRLEFALKEISVQPNSSESLVVQVERGLSRIAGRKLDQDQRYAKAVKTNPSRSAPQKKQQVLF